MKKVYVQPETTKMDLAPVKPISTSTLGFGDPLNDPNNPVGGDAPELRDWIDFD